MSEQRRWSIGELAQASGVTVRTLHHYDEIGLVPPGERTGSGHRRYTETDVRRLYRVRALRRLGFSLEEIREVLGRSAEDLTALRDLLAAQLATLAVEADRIADLRRQVSGLVERLDGSVMPEPERFLETLENLSLLDTYLSRGQREALARRRAELGADTIEEFKREWVDLLHRFRDHAARGTPIDDPEVRDLAVRWEQVGAAFRTGEERLDQRIEAAMDALWRDNGARIGAPIGDRLGWADPDDLAKVVDYMHRARRALAIRTATGTKDGTTP